MIEESYPNFEGRIIAGEYVPTKEKIRNMPNDQFRKTNPFSKKSCADCKSLVGYKSWWCHNEKAIRFRGTRRAGIIFCIFWEPDWREIPRKYKIAEYGYQKKPNLIVRLYRKLIKQIIILALMHLHLFDGTTAQSTAADFQTPPEVCRYMTSLLPPNTKTVLEPTPGQGNLVKELSLAGYQVTAPEDFFLLPAEARFDAIVMNPPFSSKSAFLNNAPAHVKTSGMKIGYHILTECMKKSDTIIALMPWFTITDSDLRLRNFMEFGLKSITALPRKTFQYIRIQTCIFELQNGFAGDTIFKSGRHLLFPHENNNLFKQ